MTSQFPQQILVITGIVISIVNRIITWRASEKSFLQG